LDLCSSASRYLLQLHDPADSTCGPSDCISHRDPFPSSHEYTACAGHANSDNHTGQGDADTVP
jgi:hypothetical protein